ncbi:ammonium transporter, partial [Vibrio parahaemolyticus]
GVCGFFGLMVVPLSNGEATFGAQLLGAAVIFVWVFGASLVVWAILKATVGIRVTEEEEMEGMDMHDCGVGAYPEFVTVK